MHAVAASSMGVAMIGTQVAGAAPSVISRTDAALQEKKKVLMKVGCQSGGTAKTDLEFKARHGVFNIDGGAPKFIPGVGWDLQDSLAKREACEKYGISLDAYHFPLTSAGIDKVQFPNVMLGKSPERDKEIEMLQQMIMVAGKTLSNPPLASPVAPGEQRSTVAQRRDETNYLEGANITAPADEYAKLPRSTTFNDTVYYK